MSDNKEVRTPSTQLVLHLTLSQTENVTDEEKKKLRNELGGYSGNTV